MHGAQRVAQWGVHILSVQMVMSPNNKYEQVNNFATSSVDLILERGSHGGILPDTHGSPLLM